MVCRISARVALSMVFGLALGASTLPAVAAESLRVLSAGAYKPIVAELAPGFEQSGFGTLVLDNDTAGAELVGPMPESIQNYTVYAAAIGASSPRASTARALIDLLKSPAAVKVIQAKGMERAE